MVKLYDTHMHTPLCKHARGQPQAYAQAGLARGLAGVIFTCHNPMPEGYSPSTRMAADQLDEYIALIESTANQMANLIDVRLGMECDYLPEYEGFLREQLQGRPFDYLLGSVHPHLPEYQERFLHGRIVAFQKTYFEHLALAAESGLFHALAHPDLVKKVHPDDWRPEQILDAIGASLDRIAASGVAMEVNTSGRNNNPMQRIYPDPIILQAMSGRDIPVVVGSDAHDPHRVGEGFDEAIDLLEAAGYEELTIILGRERSTVPLARARQALRPLDTQAMATKQ